MNHWLLMAVLLYGRTVHIGDDEWGTLISIDPDWLIEVEVAGPFAGGTTTKLFDQDDVCIENRGYLYSIAQLRDLMK
jgi:hypothetical protein